MTVRPTASHRATAAFLERYGKQPEIEARAPGRVNLIGDHTDYNGGFAMPIALQFDTVVVASPRGDSLVEVHSEGFGSATFDTNADPLDSDGWLRYLHAMGNLVANSSATSGWHGCVASDIPIGAGLSTSAAIEVASGLLTGLLTGRRTTKLELALFGRQVENEYLGVPSGVMDQIASCVSRANHATLIDCQDLSTTTLAIPAHYAVVVMDTGTRRRLIQSEFGQRRTETDTAAQALGVNTLRDVRSVAGLSSLGVGSTSWRRAHHVVSENKRTLDAAEAIRQDDIEALGLLMSESHASLRDDYEVSSPTLDLIVKIAVDTPGCFGARMTGGGFAGCAVALVHLDLAAEFCASVASRFNAKANHAGPATAQLFVAKASDGASIRRLS